MTRDDKLQICIDALNKIQRNACSCNMTYRSSCRCEAYQDARLALDMIGEAP